MNHAFKNLEQTYDYMWDFDIIIILRCMNNYIGLFRLKPFYSVTHHASYTDLA